MYFNVSEMQVSVSFAIDKGNLWFILNIKSDQMRLCEKAYTQTPVTAQINF